MATLQFASPVQQNHGDGTYGAPTTSIQFPLGGSVTLKSPGVSALGIIPTLSLPNMLSNRTDLQLTGDLAVKALGVNIFGLQIGPLLDEHASAVQLGSIPIYSNDFALNVAPVVARPFNILFKHLSINDEVSCAANGCHFDIYRQGNSIGDPNDFEVAPEEILRVGCDLVSLSRFRVLLCDDSVRTVIGETSPFAVSPNGERIAVSEMMGLTPAGEGEDVPGTMPGDAAAILAQLGFNGTFSEFFLPAGDLVPPGLIYCNADTLGDIDGDGTVAFADFLILSSNFGIDVLSNREGDLDCNGKVEFTDFLILSANFGVSSVVSTVPEPSNFPLVQFCLLVGLARRRSIARSL